MPRFGEIVVIKRNGSDGTHFPLTTTTCLFGRKTECDIRIQLPMVSKEHCKIDVNENKEVIVTNLSSVNPALLNGTFIDQPVQLKHGDVITIIDRSFRFEYPLHSTPRKTRQSTSPAVEPVQEINVESTHKKKRQQPSNSETSGKTLHENHSDDGKNLVNADVSKSPAKPSSSNRTPRRRSKSARTLSPFTELYEIFKHQIDTEPKQHDESEKKLLSKHINSPKKGNNQNILQENSAPETNLSRRRSERRSQIDIEKAINKVGKGDINFENQEISVEVNDLVKNPYSGRRLSASRKKHDSKEKDNTLLKENVKAHKQCVSGKDEEMWSNRDNTAEVSNSVVSTPKCKKSLQGSHSAEDKIEMNSSSDVLQNEHIAPKSQVSSYDKGEEIPTVQYVDFISICKGTGGERVEGQKRIGKCPSPRKSLSAEQVLKEIQDDLSLADTFKNKSHASASEPYMVAFLSSPPKNSPKQSNMLSSILKDSGSTVPILEPFMLEMESVHETSASQKSSETPKGKLTAEHKHPSKRNVRLSSSKAFEDTNISDLAIPENLFVGEQTPASLNLSPRVRSRRSHTSEHIAKADSGIQDENQQLTSMCHEKSLMLKDSVATLEYPKLPPRRSNRKSLFQAEKAAQGIGETMTPQKRKSLEINVLSEPPTKRKRVSFGGQLSPELFDKRLPPNSPLKKGAIPARRSMAFGSSSPLATGRRSRGRRYSVIQEYSKQYHGKKSESRLSQSEKSSVASSVVNLAGLSSVETISTMKSLGMSSVDRASVNRSSTSNLDDDTVASSKRTPCSRSPANNLAEISSTLPSARKLSVGNSLKKSSRLKSSVRRTTADSPARALHGHSASNPSRRASVSLRSSSSFSPDTTRSSGLSLAKNHHGTVFTDQTLSSWSSSLTSPESSPGILPTGETPFRSPGLKSRGRTPTPKSSNSIPIGQSPSSRSHVLKSSRRSPDMSPTGQTPSSWSFGLKSEGRSRTAKSPGTSTIGQTPSSMSPVLQSVRKTRGSSDSPVSRLSGTSPTEVSLTLQSLGNSHNKSPFDRTLSSRSSALKLRGSPIATRSSGVALTFQTVSPGTPALGSPNTPRDISSSKSLATESSRHSLVLKLPGKSLVAVGSSIPPAWESQSSVSPELKSIARSLDSRNFSTLSTGWTQSSRSPAARPQSISPAGRTRFSKSSTAKSLNIIPDGQTPSSRSPTAIPQSISPAGWTPSSKSPGKFPEAISHSTFRAGRAPSSRSPVLKLPGRLPVVRPHSTSPASRTPSSRSPALKSPRRPPVARPQSTSPAGRSPVLKSPGRPPVARPQSASPVGRSPARKSPRRPPVARSQNASPAGRSPSSRSPGRPPVTRTQSASPAGRSPSSGSPERPPVARTQSASPAGRSPSLRSPGRPPVARTQSASPAGRSPSLRSPGRPPVIRPQSASPAGQSPSSRSPGRPPVARPQSASPAGRSPSSRSPGRPPVARTQSASPAGRSPISRSPGRPPVIRPQSASPAGQSPSSRPPGRPPVARPQSASPAGRTPSSRSPGRPPVARTQSASPAGRSPSSRSPGRPPVARTQSASPAGRSPISRSPGRPPVIRPQSASPAGQSPSSRPPGRPPVARPQSASPAGRTPSSRSPGRPPVARTQSASPAGRSPSSRSPGRPPVARPQNASSAGRSPALKSPERPPVARSQSVSPAGRSPISRSPGRPPVIRPQSASPAGQSPSSRSPGRPPVARPQSASLAGRSPSSRSPGRPPVARPQNASSAGRSPSSRSQGRPPVTKPHSASPAGQSPSSRSPGRPPVARPQSASPAGRSPSSRSPGRPPVARPHSTSPAGRSSFKSPGRLPVTNPQSVSPAGQSPALKSPGRPPVARLQSASPDGRSPSLRSPALKSPGRPPVARPHSTSTASRSSLKSPGRLPVANPQSASPASRSPSLKSPGRPPVARLQSASPAGRSLASKSPGRPPVARLQSASPAGRSLALKSPGRPPVARPHSTSPAGKSSLKSPGKPPVARPQSASPAGRSPSLRSPALKSPGRPPVARPHSTSPAGRSPALKSPGRPPVARPHSTSPAGRSPALKSPGKPPVARPHSTSPAGRSPALKSPGRPPVARPHSTSPAGRSPVLKSPGRPPVARPHSASPAGLSPALKSPGRPPVAHSTSPAGRSPSLKSVGRPSAARSQSTSLTGQSPSSRSPALKSAGRPSAARSPNTSLAIRSLLTRSSTRRLSSNSPSIVKSSMVTLPVDTRSPTGKSVSASRMSPGRRPISRAANALSSIAKTPGRPSSSWSTSILPNTELPSKSLALMSSIIFSDKLALDSSNARAFHSNSNEITHSNNTESIHSSPEMRELSLRKVYSEFTTVSSPHTPYKKGRFSISRIRTPPDSYKNIPEQLSVKGNFMGLNMPENCLTVQSEMLPVSSTPKQLRRKSMRSAAKKTPLCRQSNGNDALDAVRSKRKSGASVANLLVAKSWADVVKLGVARPQVKHVKKDALRAKLSKKKLTKSKQTPRKIKDHIGTGHADSPATIVIGRAHSRPVNMIGRAPLVLTNYAFNQNMKTNESFTGLVELFSTPVNEKERRNSRLSRVPKTDVNPTPFLAEISQMLTPKESGEMFISPLSTPDTTKRRHYNQDAVTRLLQGQRASSSSFVGIKKLMKTPKGRTAILKNVPGTNRNSTEVLEETDLKEMKKLMKSKNVTGIKSLIKISKEKRDSEASFSGVKRLFKTPRQKTKSVTDAVALKRLLKTPKQKKQLETNIVRHTRRTRILKQKGQPVKDMIGIRRILKTPKQKGQLVEDMVGVKRILKTPKQKEQPVEDMVGVRRIFKTPKQKGQPVEDMVGVRRIFKTPKQKGQPVEDMVGVRRIFKTPKQKGQPLEDMVGVKAIFDSPTKSKVTKELSVLQQNNASPKSPPSRNADESRVSVFGQNKVKEAYIKTSAVKLRSFRNKKSEQELKKTDQVKNNVISTRQSQHLNSLESSDRKILTRSSRKKQNNATTEAPAFLMKTKLVKEAQPCKLERKYNKNVKENDIKKMTDKNITTIQEIISLSNKDVDGYTLPQTRNKSQKKRVKYIFASDTREESKETVSKTEGNKGMTEELKETTEVENSHTSQRSRSLTKTESPKEKVNGRSIRKRQNIDAQKDFADMYIKLVEETNPAIKLPRKLNQNLNESDIKELSIENAQAKNVQVMQEDISLSAGEISISSLPKKRGRLRKVKIVGSSVAAQEKPMYKIKGKASEITKQIKEVENEIQKREVFSYSSVTEKKRGRRKKCIEDNAVFETTNQAKLKDVLKVKETARSTRIKRSGTQSIRDQESGESVFHDSQKKTKKSSPRIEKNLQTSEILTVNNSLLKQIDHIIETKKVAGQVKKSVQWHPLLTDFKTSVQTIKPNQETLEDEKEISSTSRRPGRKSILELKPSVVPAKRSRRENTVENNKQVSITTHFTIERKQTRLQTAKNIQKVTKQKITGSSNETVTETKTLRNAKQKAHPSQQFGKICETKKQIQEVESILSGQEESKELIVETRNVGGSLEDQTSIMPKSKVTRTAKRAVREQTIKSDSSINKTKAVTGRNQTISDPFSPFIGSPSFSALILDSNPSKNVPKADSRLRRYRAAAKNDDLHTKENEAMQKTSPVSNKNKAPIKTVTDFQPISQRTRRKAFAGAVVQETLIHTKEPSRNIRAALKRKLTNEVVGVIHQETSQQKLENQLESEGLTRAGRRANLSKNKIELEKNDFSYNAQDNISAAGGRQCLKEMEVTAHKMGRGKADKSENRRRGHSMAHEKNPSPVSLSRRGRRKQMTDEIHTDTAVQSIPSRSKSSLDDRTPAKKLKMGIEHNTVQQKNKRRKGR
uniref:Proliferation marker protein Ki-67-like isoform X2 n=1 Tax=Geotrypetes seraphini TaxID=260995 RepID=A0A6P8RC57_GEOSA|nr:proliferation marker protein Ki-67-like isoform X2 [Geotrypetes seraphini]